MSEPVERQVADALRPVAARFGVDLDASQVARLAAYSELLLAWNDRVNLSGARDLETLLREHVADALALMPHLPLSGECVDVGSGAGLPGIVLAIARPRLRFTLAEPSQKRRAFLSAVIRAAGLENVAISPTRAEDLARESGGSFAFAVARAVFPIGEWMALGARLVRPGGVIAGLAGGTPPLEVTADELHPYDTGAGPRNVVIRRK